MSTAEEERVELSDEQLIDEYLTIAFSNGFSKGTANVDARDMKKLRPLLNYYAKKPHPFTACVRDNRKRFGPRTEAICAVVKDLIMHSTKWRKGRKGGKAHMSAEAVQEIILHDLPDEFLEWLHDVDEADMEQWARDSQGDVEELTLSEDDSLLAEMFFQEGEIDGEDGVIWKTILREGTWKYSPGPGQVPKRKAITVTKSGKSDPSTMTIAMGEILKNFQGGAVEHVQIPLKHEAGVLENTGFARDLRLVKGKAGKWELQAALDFTEPEVKGKVERGTIANTSAGIMFNFIRKEDGKKHRAVLDHVALTNRPWLNGLRPFGAQLSEEEVDGIVLFSEEGVDLDSQPIYELRGVADSLRLAISREPEQGEKDKLTAALDSILEVMAANEKQQGAEPCGDSLARPVGYSDDGGGETVPEEQEETKQDGFLAKVGLSEDEVQARLDRYDELEAESKRNRVAGKVREWEGAKKAPAMIKEAERILLADDGAVAVHLAQDGGRQESLTASAIVERLVAASPEVKLADDPVNDKDVTEGTEPDEDAKRENEDANLSHEVRALASSLYLEGTARTEEEAVAMAKKELGEGEKKA